MEKNSTIKVDRQEIPSQQELLVLFNKRDFKAFGQVYLQFFDEIHFYTKRLFASTEEAPSDIVQDLFMTIVNTYDPERVETVLLEGCQCLLCR